MKGGIGWPVDATNISDEDFPNLQEMGDQVYHIEMSSDSLDNLADLIMRFSRGGALIEALSECSEHNASHIVIKVSGFGLHGRLRVATIL